MSESRRSTILVVEDNEPSRDALCRRLARRGYGIVSCGDGLEAVQLARTALPNLILMDLGLPGIDGWQATSELKNDDATRHIPIIVLSAHAMTSHRDLALEAGCDDFDTKPVRFDQLLRRVEALLQRTEVV